MHPHWHYECNAGINYITESLFMTLDKVIKILRVLEMNGMYLNLYVCQNAMNPVFILVNCFVLFFRCGVIYFKRKS